MPLEPVVDAVDVKRMLALRQEPEDLNVLELRQADGALEPGSGAPEGGEPEEGKRLYHRLVDTREPPGPREGVVVTSPVQGTIGPTAPVAELGVDEEDEGDGEHDREDPYDDC